MLRSSRSARPAAALVASLAAAALLLPTAASAGTDVHKDARGDVEKASPSARQRYPQLDVRRIQTDYTSSSLQLAMKVQELTPDGYTVVWRVVAGEREFAVAHNPANGSAIQQFEGPPLDVPCTSSDVFVQIAPDENTVTLSLDPACVGSPDAVRTGALTGAPLRRGNGFRGDDARRTGGLFITFGDIALGPDVPLD